MGRSVGQHLRNSVARLHVSIALAFALITSACSPKINSNFSSADARSLSGTIFPLTRLFASRNNSLDALPGISKSAFAATCDYTQVTVGLYTLDENGNLSDEPLIETKILDAQARFRFDNIGTLNLNTEAGGMQYLLRATGCADGEVRAPITSWGDIEITAAHALIGAITQGTQNQKVSLKERTPQEIDNLLRALSGIISKSANMSDAFSTLNANAQLKNEFEGAFGHSVSVADLQQVEPQIVSITWPSASVTEGSNSSFFVGASHWNPNYTIRYLWKLDGVTVSNSSTFNYLPGKNAQGAHILALYVGSDNGSGGIDTTVPYFYQSKTISVANAFPPLAPVIALAGGATIVSSPTVSVVLTTGGSLSQCSTFSDLALTDDDETMPPGSEFTLSCSTSGTQTLSYTISDATDGFHTLRLWARDASGAISATPRQYTFFLDQSPPTVAISSAPSTITSQTTASIVFTGSDPGGGTVSTYECKIDSGSYTACSSPYSVSGLSAGAHTASIRATDVSGNIGAATTASWTIDLTAPSTSFSSTPLALTSANAANFAFSATDAGGGSVTSYQCALDSATFNTCTSPVAASALASGSHVFSARALDSAGNIGTAQSYAWTIDTTGPTTTLSGNPPSLTYLGSGQFTFSAQDFGGATVAGLECKLDSGAYTTCTSPYSVSALADGAHQFQVRATDTLGNTGSAVSFSWTVDSQNVLVSINTKPDSITKQTNPSFTFSASASSGAASFECKLDSGSYTACSSPQSYSGVSAGNHTFLVRPIDGSSNAGTAVSYSWIIDTTAPTMTVSQSPAALVATTSASFTFTATDSGGGEVSRFECKTDSGSFATCTSPHSINALSTGAHTVQIRVVDSADNTSAAQTFTWTIDQIGPTTTISSGPASIVNTSTASVAFTATDSGGGTVASYECSLNSATYAACTSPHGLTGLTAGSHVLSIRAIDSVGNTGSVVSRSWTIDQTAPTTTISTGPATYVNTTSASLTFSATDSGGGTVASYECSIDSGAYSACTSPKSYTSLSTGAHSVSVRAIDTAGNTGTETTRSWTIDQSAPTVTISSGPSSAIALASASLVFTGADTGGSGIARFECKLDSGSYADCVSPMSYTGLADGAHTVLIRAVDAAGNTGTAASHSWSSDTTAPSPPTIAFSSNSTTTEKRNTIATTLTVTSCTDRTHVLISENGAAPLAGDSRWKSCVTTAGGIAFTLTDTSEGARALRAWAKDAVGNISATSSALTLTYDSVPPNATQLRVVGDLTTTGNNNLLLNFQSTANVTPIAAFCLKYNYSSTPPSNDSCWTTLSSISESNTLSLSISNYPFQIGTINGAYDIRIWFRDELGNTSTGTDTTLQDFYTINYTPDPPPTISGVTAANSDAPASPLSSSDTTVPSGSSVFIQWKIEDNSAIPAGNISIYYTTNESTFVLASSGLSNSANGACTPSGGATGCFKWTNGSPTSSYFKIQVRVQDSGVSQVFSTSNALNTGSIRFLAGNTSLGINGSARSALLLGANEGGFNDAADNGAVAVTNQGYIFYKYPGQGLAYVSPEDGLLRLLIPQTGTQSGVGGTAANATLASLAQIVLDHQGNLLIWDFTRLLRLNLSQTPWTLEHLIGGGANTTSGSLARSFNLGSANPNYLMLTPTPDGRIYFQRGKEIWYYLPGATLADATVVKHLTLEGLGTGNMSGLYASFNNGTCPMNGTGIAYDKASSSITKIMRKSGGGIGTECLSQPSNVPNFASAATNFDINTGLAQTPHSTAVDWSGSFYTGLNGRLYLLAHSRANLRIYEPTTNTFNNVIGNGQNGRCADGTAALSCPATIMSVHVNEFGKIYFLDMGVIRTIDADGKVQTLAGQPRNYGIGENPVSARFSQINYFAATDTEVYVKNKLEHQLVKFPLAGGNLVNVAGTGVHGSPGHNAVAAQSNIPECGWGMPCGFVVNPTLQRLYYTISWGSLSYLDLSTGRWVIPSGTVQTNGRISYAGQSPTRIISYLTANSGQYGANNIRTINPTDHSNTIIYGKTADSPSPVFNLCNDQLGTDCFLDRSMGLEVALQYKYDSVTNQWLLAYRDAANVRAIPHDGGTISTFEATSRGIRAFDFRRVGADSFIYYCATDGKLYKRNVDTNVETELAFPSSTISCNGHALHYHEGRNSLIFIYVQNSMYGIAEWVNP